MDSKILNVLLTIVFCYFEFISALNPEYMSTKQSRTLSRKRRFVAFPEGSSFSCAGCMTVGVLGEPAGDTTAGMYTFGLNWGIAYELPNETQSADAVKKYKKGAVQAIVAKRRNRRDLYEKLETIMESMGYNGRDCILKTLCETTQRIMPGGPNMIEEMFRLLFTFPVTKAISSEPPVHAIYDAAHRLGSMLENCHVYKCPLSLVDLAQGYYNAKPPNIPDSDLVKPWALFANSFGFGK